MSHLDEDQIRYLRDVLGLKNVILPSVVPGESLAGEHILETTSSAEEIADEKAASFQIHGSQAQARMIAIFALGASSFPIHGECRDLAEKMIKAMKVGLSEALWVDWVPNADEPVPAEIVSLLRTAGMRPVLVFGEIAAEVLLSGSTEGKSPRLGEWMEVQKGSTRLMATHSLSELLTAPEKKKSAWAHMQAVMRVL